MSNPHDHDRRYPAAAAVGLVSLWGEPDKERFQRWQSARFRYEMTRVAIALQHGYRAERALWSTLVRPYDTVTEEYEQLFVGPGTVPCPPYETFWRPVRTPTQVMGAISGKVADIYDAMGMKVKPQLHELPDHLEAEWEALAIAWQGDAEMVAVGSILLTDHLAQWMPAFCAKVTTIAPHGFYASVARLTLSWLPILQEFAATISDFSLVEGRR